jgi:glycosyltransferase involved in cell wall biosynthesis
VLFEALASCSAEGCDVRLLLVGAFETQEYETAIRSLAAKLGITHLLDFVGFTQQVNAQLARMDLFVLPSLFGEGLPMVVLEAMAAGVPVVATRVEGVPEAVRDGLEGLIAAPNDAADLARAISRFVRGEVDWQAIRTAAHRRQAEALSDRSMAEGVARVYRAVLDG